MLILVVHLDLRISPRFSEKYEMTQMLFSGVCGKTIHEKTRSKKSNDTLTVPLSTKETWIYMQKSLYGDLDLGIPLGDIRSAGR